MTNTAPVAALILAAGASLRFGSDKRQARLPSGQTMLEAVIRLHQQVFETVWVVTREHDDFAEAVCRATGAQRVVCPDAAHGMGHSLATGMAVATAQPGLQAVMVSLGDMPAVLPDTLRALLGRFQATGATVVPRYAEPSGAARAHGRWGNPRILPRACWPSLLALTGDQGAGAVLEWADAEVVEVNDPGILFDADTPQDLADLPAT